MVSRQRPNFLDQEPIVRPRRGVKEIRQRLMRNGLSNRWFYRGDWHREASRGRKVVTFEDICPYRYPFSEDSQLRSSIPGIATLVLPKREALV